MKSIKAIGFFLITIISYSMTYGQDDVLNEYNNHIFPCDDGGTTIEINICSGIRRDYADSLLNMVYNKIMRSLDKDILEAKKMMKLE